MEIGPHVFEKSGRQTHRQTDRQTDRQTATLYIIHRKASANDFGHLEATWQQSPQSRLGVDAAEGVLVLYPMEFHRDRPKRVKFSMADTVEFHVKTPWNFHATCVKHMKTSWRLPQNRHLSTHRQEICHMWLRRRPLVPTSVPLPAVVQIRPPCKPVKYNNFYLYPF